MIITLIRKPFPKENTICENILSHKTGVIKLEKVGDSLVFTHDNCRGSVGEKGIYGPYERMGASDYRIGRFPSNVIFNQKLSRVLSLQGENLVGMVSDYFKVIE